MAKVGKEFVCLVLDAVEDVCDAFEVGVGVPARVNAAVVVALVQLDIEGVQPRRAAGLRGFGTSSCRGRG